MKKSILPSLKEQK